ncbi:hypothetical protein [Pelosinus baikalensis]|nr:hypothetical protein [Pelosinus baikalensis]
MNKYIFNTAIQRRAQQTAMLKALVSVILLGIGFIYILFRIPGQW